MDCCLVVHGIHSNIFSVCTWCGYEVPGMILLFNLIVIRTHLCMFHLTPVMISVVWKLWHWYDVCISVSCCRNEQWITIKVCV